MGKQKTGDGDTKQSSRGGKFLLCDISWLSPRWQSWLVRMQSGFILISSFYLIVQMGVLGLLLLTYTVQISSFHEATETAISITKSSDLRQWSWQLLFLANLYWLDPVLEQFVPPEIVRWKEVVCYGGYLVLLVWFLRGISDVDNCLTRYGHFAWTHILIIFLTFQASLLLRTLQHGMMWYIFSVSIITINDIAAYMCGFFFGRTPLIVLSPKKTLEGYLGGGVFTVAIGPVFGLLLSRYEHLACPTAGFTVLSCTLEPFNLARGQIPSFLWHSLYISIFASTFGPTAGFLCSGFKRACKRKNFGNLIPGHGGVLDRCDCMFLMASFAYIYTANIAHPHS
eukprot:TRINITY_DN6028_c0_g1_i2.p1 TRINITY_DN6028_c0_g1~~TRINITY_DN6028_c0_g1_i2.p1  ORF type:complete len:340 (+),score=57.77 TRINITY_DN6028_c0_g1_i2:110-1129(+)